VKCTPGEKALNTAIDYEEKETRPPARYNEATLLSSMESAGKLVEDEELRAAMSERGLGTPATRAAIIEGLIQDKYVQRDGRSLVATAKGIGLIEELESIGLDTLCAPQLTGDWEYRLKQMEHGGLERDNFMEDIRTMTRGIVERIRAYIDEVNGLSFPDLDAACPECGTKRFRQTDAHFSCSSPDCRFRIRKTVASRRLTDEEARRLIAEGTVGPLEGFRSRAGKEFAATLKLDEAHKVTFVFDESSREDVELNDPITECPLCREAGRRAQIHATADSYVCEQYFEEAKCPAKIPKTLLTVDIPREQAVKFFDEGRTDLIRKFISKKRGRPFDAHLILNGKGKKLIEWEFPPYRGRGSRAAGKKAAKKA
jgi:DNA topoisomerase-3